MNRLQLAFHFCTFLLIFFTVNGLPEGVTDGQDIMLGIGVKLDDTGEYPSVAVNEDGFVVIVHDEPSSLLKKSLYYRLGVIGDFLTVDFLSPTKVVLDEEGSYADVAINNKNQLIVAYISKSMLTYRTGSISDSNGTMTAQWGPATRYVAAISVSVSLNDDGTVVLLYDTGNVLKKSLFFMMGSLAGEKIVFSGDAHTALDSGQTPHIALNNFGDVIEVHRGGSLISNRIVYTVGKLDTKNGSITWSPSAPLDSGFKPSIAINDDRLACEAHQSEADNPITSHLSSRLGTLQPINGSTIFGPERRFDSGLQASISCNRRFAVHVHKSASSLFKGLYYTVSLIIDRSRWMEKSAPEVLEKSLWQIALPATHDSGAVDVSHETSNSKAEVIGYISKFQADAQEENFYEQLSGGVRYFDMRPTWKDGKLYTYHFNIGPEIADLMGQVAKFLSEVSKEFVVIRVSHFGNFDNKTGGGEEAKHRALIELMKSALSPYLLSDFPQLSSADLIQTPIGNFVKKGPRVVIFYNDSYIERYPQAGFWQNISVFDQYSNTDKLEKMQEDQLKKYSANFGAPDHLFLLSYTLTLQPPFIPTTPTLHDLTKPAGASLAQFLKENANVSMPINVLYVDFYADSRVTDLAVILNTKSSNGSDRYAPRLSQDSSSTEKPFNNTANNNSIILPVYMAQGNNASVEKLTLISFFTFILCYICSYAL